MKVKTQTSVFLTKIYVLVQEQKWRFFIMANQQTFLEVNEGKRKREELTLPILHFAAADALPNTESWIDTLQPKAFCAWLKLHTLVNRTDEAMEKNGNRMTIPRSIEDLTKKIFKVSKPTFYNTILKPLWNYGLIDIIEWKDDKKIGQKAMNIIVYHYPKNQKSLETKPLEKVRDYDKDYKSNGKTYGDLGGKLRHKDTKQNIITYKNVDLLYRKKTFTVRRNNNLLQNVVMAHRKKTFTVTVKKLLPINSSNPIINISNKDIKEDTIIDTRSPDLSTGKSKQHIQPKNTDKEKDEIYKQTLKEYIPNPIFQTLNILSDDFEEMYNWYGILLRAKDSVQKERDTLIFLDEEQTGITIDQALQKGIRVIKKQKRDAPDNYLYVTMRNTFDKLFENSLLL